MKILGIETSCDETAVAVVENGEKILSSIVSSSLPIHRKTGGVVPENAARQQLRDIIPAIDASLRESSSLFTDLSAISVTVGPGLIGSLLVGVETAKVLASFWNKPLIPVNHLLGHLYVNFLEDIKPSFPLLFFVVSGGHTHLYLVESHQSFKLIGQTLDDAAGEAFDKVGRLLGLSYPGGPEIEKLAVGANDQKFSLPKPMLDSKDLNLSFSGLKTSVLRQVQKEDYSESDKRDLAACFQKVVGEVLYSKLKRAIEETNISTVVVGGGVLANKVVRESFAQACNEAGATLFFPSKNSLSTDNAIGVATAAFYNFSPWDWRSVEASANLSWLSTPKHNMK